ncbi:MAG: phosphomannose isomerase type II C-terminal cupin domain [Jaaginema sp. PMC 1079.18]|nr:phosphomannose isomerase type II C-terminal cupin domain [Jaaginema sp. PMC 1080.18]MEC4849893.1 phosphomannose isomerase type II C-terminal cupin domain [Jaaginema sp. PMC 1079.18]MEC4866839.1 phosphomannose isomerase type II C-terminal cupin domain [Jaaginema sp. PMC 1078.18]
MSDVQTDSGKADDLPEKNSSPKNDQLQPGTVNTRPWGTVTVLERGERYHINRIEVKPGHHISTQMHYHRSEHWIVVSGTAKVICDGHEKVLMQKQSTYVPLNTRHRVENPGVIPLVMIEVQNGEYLGEDDIIRYQDNDETQ